MRTLSHRLQRLEQRASSTTLDQSPEGAWAAYQAGRFGNRRIMTDVVAFMKDGKEALKGLPPVLVDEIAGIIEEASEEQ